MFKFRLGETVRDKVTGFKGIVTSAARHLSGCDTYGVVPTALKDGAPQDTRWFDEPRLESKGGSVLSIDERPVRTGADNRVPTATRSAGR